MKTSWGTAIRQTRAGSIAFMDLSAAAEYKPAKLITPVMSERSMNSAPWAIWGKDNLMPQKMVADIASTGILSGIIDGKARFALCEGMVPAIVKRDPKTGQRIIHDYVEDDEIQLFMDTSDHFTSSFGLLKDLSGVGSWAAGLILNKKSDKVAAYTRRDMSQLRYEKMDASGISRNVYLAANWAKIRSKNDKELLQLPLLNSMMPLDDLRERAKAGQKEFVMTGQHPSWGCSYYPPSMWYAALQWVKIAQGVPEMKSAMFENSMLIKYMVVIYQEYWDTAYPDGAWAGMSEEEREQARGELFDDLEKFLVGAENAHKTFFVEGQRDAVNNQTWQHIEIKVIDNKTVSGEGLPDAAAANSEIAFSMLFNPAIIGATMPSGPYTNSQGGSSVREAVLLQIILHELERRSIQRIMNVVKWFNGWADRYKGLDFIIPATVLTTLDTGGSSKPVTLGVNGANREDQEADRDASKKTSLKNAA